MKNKALRTGLEWMLLTSLVASAYCFVRFYYQSKSLRLIRPQYEQEAMIAQRNNAFMNSLKMRVDQYAQRDEGLRRFLEAAGFAGPQHPSGSAPAKPAGK